MDYNTLTYQDWLRGWKSWASNRKRGKLAQFIVGLLEAGEGARLVWAVNTPCGRFEWRALVMCELHTCFEEAYLSVNKQKCLCTKCLFIEHVDASSTSPPRSHYDVVRSLCPYTQDPPSRTVVHLW